MDNWFCNLQLAGKDWQIRAANANPLVTSYKYNENYRSLKSIYNKWKNYGLIELNEHEKTATLYVETGKQLQIN